MPEPSAGLRVEMDLVVDLLLIACLLLTALTGIRNGFFREVFALGGLAMGLIGGLRLTTPILEHAPVWMRRSGIAWGALFVALFLVIYGSATVAGRGLALAWEGKKPTGTSRFLGFVLGGVRGFALVLFLGAAMVMLGPPERPPLSRSRVLPRIDPSVRAAVGLVLPAPARAKVLERWDRLPFRRTAAPAGQSSGPAGSI